MEIDSELIDEWAAQSQHRYSEGGVNLRKFAQLAAEYGASQVTQCKLDSNNAQSSGQSED